jgi:hypothetical protein
VKKFGLMAGHENGLTVSRGNRLSGCAQIFLGSIEDACAGQGSKCLIRSPQDIQVQGSQSATVLLEEAADLVQRRIGKDYTILSGSLEIMHAHRQLLGR